MRKAARIIGLIWMAGAAVAGLVLLGSGVFRSSRGIIYLVFGAALPGHLLYRWARGSEPRKSKAAAKSQKAKALLEMTPESGHVMRLETDPLASMEESAIPPSLKKPGPNTATEFESRGA